jgi:osmotically-inducible protein OsmY
MCTPNRRPNGKLAWPPVPSLLRLFPVAASFAGLLALALLPLRAADPRSPSADYPNPDTQLTFKARGALRDADGLTFLNLGVRIHRGVATLWGSVPTAELAQRAVETVRLVPGVTTVKNELAVVPPDGFGPEILPSISLAPETWPAPLATATPPPGGALVTRPGEHGPVPGQPALSGQTPPAAETTAETRPSLSGAVSLLPPIAGSSTPPAKPGDPPVMLLSPVVPGSSPAPTRADTPPTWRPVQPAAPASVPLAQAVEQVRQADTRFTHLIADVRDRVVFLRGTVAHGEDTMALAQALSRVPGVERVVVDKVQVMPPTHAAGR